MRHAYTIRGTLGRETKELRCTSAWIAFEQHNRLVRQGWKVRILDYARKPVTESQLEAAARIEIGTAVNGEKYG